MVHKHMKRRYTLSRLAIKKQRNGQKISVDKDVKQLGTPYTGDGDKMVQSP